jgi:hypothetical protein
MSVLQHFEEYQRSRVKFVQAVAEAATRPQNIEVMNNAGVMQLLRPLLLDNVPSIQQTAALALGRLANYSEDLAEGVVGNEILPQLVYSLSDQNVSWIFFCLIVSSATFTCTHQCYSFVDCRICSDFIRRLLLSCSVLWQSILLIWLRLLWIPMLSRPLFPALKSLTLP